MAQQVINVGTTANDGTGDALRTALQKVNSNFQESYARVTWVSVKDAAFGATGNGTTDDTAAIQAAIDYALVNGIGEVFIPHGTYKTSNTIHVGYGWGPAGGSSSGQTVNIIVSGETGVSDGSFGFSNWTRIAPTFVDRPVINIQGVSNGGIRRLWIQGQTAMAGIGTYGNYTGWSCVVRQDRANYIPAGAATYQNSPFCGVCIDGYYGSAPANPYPTPTYPSWFGNVGVSSPYGRNPSTNAFVQECYIEKTYIGIALQPNADGNGDFMDFDRNRYSACVAGVAVGNTQARSTNFFKSTFSGIHTCIDGYLTGASLGGNCSGNMDLMHADYCYQIFRVNGGWQKGIYLTNFYSEVMSRIGEVIGSGTPITFTNCNLDCTNDTGSDRLNLPHFDAEATAQFVVFTNCKFGDMWGALHLNCTAQFDGCSWILPSGPTGVEGAALTKLSYTFMDQLVNDPTRNVFRNCNLNAHFYSGYDVGSAMYWHSFGVLGFSPVDYLINGTVRAGMFISAVTWSGRTFTGTVPATFCQVGDVFKTPAGWCVLTAVSGTTITATMLTLYRWTGGVYSMMTNDGFGVWTARNDTYMNANYSSLANSFYYPINVFDISCQTNNNFWKTTAGSPTLTYANYAGTPATLPTGLTTASKVLWVDSGNTVLPTMPFPNSTTVSAVGTTTLTMSANAISSGYWSVAPGVARIA